jgi:hypothetical protein
MVGSGTIFATSDAWTGPPATLHFGDWGLSGLGDYYRMQLVRRDGRSQELWAQKIAWVLPQAIDQTVTVTAQNLTTHAVMWFTYDVSGHTERPAKSILIRAGLRFLPSAAYITAAGCYRLTARWPGGGWDAVFGAGS